MKVAGFEENKGIQLEFKSLCSVCFQKWLYMFMLESCNGLSVFPPLVGTDCSVTVSELRFWLLCKDSDDVGDISSSFTKDHPIPWEHHQFYTRNQFWEFGSTGWKKLDLFLRGAPVCMTPHLVAPITLITSIHLLIVEAAHIWCVVDPHS